METKKRVRKVQVRHECKLCRRKDTMIIGLVIIVIGTILLMAATL